MVVRHQNMNSSVLHTLVVLTGPVGVGKSTTLKKRGHEVMTHTFNHVNLTTIPLDEAKRDIDRCIAEF